MAKQVGFGQCGHCGHEAPLVVCLVNEAPHCERAHQQKCMFPHRVRGATINYFDMKAYLEMSARLGRRGVI